MQPLRVLPLLLRTSLLLLLSAVTTLCFAQLTPRSASSLESRALGTQRPLPADEAFPYYVSDIGPGQLRITWTPAPAHYLYRHTLRFSLQVGDSNRELPVDLPTGLQKTDEFFGDIEAYYDPVSVDITLPATVAAAAVLLIQYQGCADWGFCYPPQRREFPLQP